MTIVKFDTHLTTNPVYSDEGVSFKVIFGEWPIFCFTNRADVVFCLSRMDLSLGDSIEMTAIMLNVEKGFNQTETTLKVIEVKLLETYFMHRKRKREDKKSDGSLSPLNNKKRKGDNGSPIVEDMSLCSTESGWSYGGGAGTVGFDIQEYEGTFLDYYQGLGDKIKSYRTQELESEIEERLNKVAYLMERLYQLFTAMQNLSGSDELAVISRLVNVVKRIISTMDNLAPKFSENDTKTTTHCILLPTYIFNRFMKNRK